MKTRSIQFGSGLVCTLALMLAGCGGSGDPDVVNADTSVVGDGSTQANTGFLTLSVSDAPIRDASKVCVRFDGVELKHAEGDDKEVITFEDPVVINLLSYQGSDSHPIVTNAEVPAGEYKWIRLLVQADRDLNGGANDGDPSGEDCDAATENSYLVRKSGGVYNLFIPSGSQRGLQLIKDIIIPVNRVGEYTAEWDLGKSFNGPPGQMPDVMMKPVVKLVANNEVGTLDGQVADELISWGECDADFPPSVYVFDQGVTPNPFDDPFADDDAIATGLVEQQMLDDGSMPWLYSIGFLLTGNYEAAYTCNGELFAPLAGKSAEILLDQTTTVDFVLADAPGILTGMVDGVFFDPEAPESGFCDDAFTPMVYVFNDGVEPNFSDEPVATGEVTLDADTDQYGYRIPLMGDTYNTAFSCSGTDFIPAAGKAALIEPAETTVVDFVAADAPPPVGDLTGTVASELVTADSCAADFEASVYVFDEGVTPNSTDTPVATATVTLDSATETYSYLVEDLLALPYVAAFTCTGEDFVPVDGKEAVIEIDEVTTVDFVADDATTS